MYPIIILQKFKLEKMRSLKKYMKRFTKLQQNHIVIFWVKEEQSNLFSYKHLINMRKKSTLYENLPYNTNNFYWEKRKKKDLK